MIQTADDFRHALPDRPFARESIFHNLHLPEHGISGFLYTWVDATHTVGYVVTFFGSDGEQILLDHQDGFPAAGSDFDDWSVGGLTLQHVKPLEVARSATRVPTPRSN